MNVDLWRIPEEIIVHMGPCSIPCQNTNVFFVDYIKNTVSREINPLWGENAIKAIIYAVTTCVLYKINSGWYRKKGYDFDITLWREEDMLYEPEKEIYLNIGMMVDELFDNFISINGDFPGLITCSDEEFEKYKEFAVKHSEKGAQSEDILKEYFGENIEIIYKTRHDNDICDACTFPISYGDTGETVKVLQENLNFLSYDFPVIPKIIPVDKEYSLNTSMAVRSFQKNFYLEETGIVDKSTWYKIRKYYFDASRLYEFINGASDIVNKDAEDIKDDEILYALNVIEYFNPYIEINMLRINQKEKLSRNILEFQKYYKMNETGIADKDTIEKIVCIYKIITENIPDRYFKNIAHKFSGNILRKGDTGNDVMHLQSYLRLISENIKKINFSDITGIYDNATESAVKIYQEMYGLPINGIVGAITWKGISELYNFFSSGTCKQ